MASDVHKAEKGAFRHYLDNGDDIVPAAKKARVNIKTARGIKGRADTITHPCAENSELPPSLHHRTIIAPILGRPRVLLELNILILVFCSIMCRFLPQPAMRRGVCFKALPVRHQSLLSRGDRR